MAYKAIHKQSCASSKGKDDVLNGEDCCTMAGSDELEINDTKSLHQVINEERADKELFSAPMKFDLSVPDFVPTNNI